MSPWAFSSCCRNIGLSRLKKGHPGQPQQSLGAALPAPRQPKAGQQGAAAAAGSVESPGEAPHGSGGLRPRDSTDASGETHASTQDEVDDAKGHGRPPERLRLKRPFVANEVKPHIPPRHIPPLVQLRQVGRHCCFCCFKIF